MDNYEEALAMACVISVSLVIGVILALSFLQEFG